MGLLVAILIALDVLVLIGVLTLQWRRRREPTPSGDIFVAPRPSGLRGRERQLLSVEILDPREVAARRGWALGIAGTFAPGLVRRLVYDRTRAIMQRELAAQGVRADVRLHTLRPAQPMPPGRPQTDVVEAVVVDAPPPLDL